jgi:surface carbohydrate biosynthesis protein
MAAKQTTVFIPVESQVRELDAKLLLACVAAEQGYAAVLGSRGPLNHAMGKFPRGIFLAKGVRSIARRMFGILRGLGHEIVAWDEEALVRFPREDYYRRRLAEDSIAFVSRIFAWGEDDAKVIREFPGIGDTPVVVTGNPRVDLLRPDVRGYFDPEVAEIRRRFGDFILINTNFGFVNAFAKSLNLLQPSSEPGGERPLGDNTRGMKPEFARGLAEHKNELFGNFRTLVPAVAAAFPEHRVVVRPHPAEDHAAWKETAGDHANVHVVSEMSVIPWLIASSVLIHNGCTTAVEAAVLRRPAIAFRPVSNKEFDFEFPNSLSEEAYSVEELIAAARDIVGSDPRSRERASIRSEILRHHIASLEGPLASDQMVEALNAAGFAGRKFRSDSLYQYWRGRRRLHNRIVAKREAAAIPGDRNTSAYHDHRFPGVSIEELRGRIERFGEQLDRFHDLRVESFTDHIFRITR